MSESSEIKQRLRNYIVTEFLSGGSSANLKDDTLLRTSGVLDSIATLKLVRFVENSLGVEVEAHEAGGENFQCMSDRALFIERGKAQAGYWA
jgi:acyl carrier protein